MGDLEDLDAAEADAESRYDDEPIRATSTACPSRDKIQVVDDEMKDWVEIFLVDDWGKSMAREPYRVKLPGGRTIEGRLDDNGYVRIEGIDPGDCDISFPDLDRERQIHEPPAPTTES